MTLLQNILNAVTNFLRKEEKKLPTILLEAADFGIKYTTLLETAIASPQATEITALVPEAETLRTEILAILNELMIAFKAVDAAYAKGTLFIGAGKIAALQVGSDVPASHILLAVQAQWINKAA